MTKASAILLALLCLSACGKSNSDSKLEMETSEAFELIDFKTKIKMLNFTSSEQVKIKKAASLIRNVLLSEEFRQEILQHEYNGEKTFANNRGLTNEQIYEHILKGSEKLSPGADYEMDVTLVAYYADAVTVGYTLTNTQKIWMNRKFFSRSDAAEVTTNIVHEWIHKLGFGHDVSATPSRPYSVPYAVGYIVRRLAKEI